MEDLLGPRGASPCRDCGSHSPERLPGRRCAPCWEARVAARNTVFWNGPTGLYRLYDRGGLLLYVGLSTEPERRFREHRRSTPWWRDVDPTRTTVEWLNYGGNTAIGVERRVIAAELPAANREWAVALPAGCPRLPKVRSRYGAEARYLMWRRWFVLWRDCRLNGEELAAQGSGDQF